MGYFKAWFAGECVAEGWASDEQSFANQKKLQWYHENGGVRIAGGY